MRRKITRASLCLMGVMAGPPWKTVRPSPKRLGAGITHWTSAAYTDLAPLGTRMSCPSLISKGCGHQDLGYLHYSLAGLWGNWRNTLLRAPFKHQATGTNLEGLLLRDHSGEIR